MVAFPRINAPKPAPSRRFSTFSTSSVGRLPWKNGLPRSLSATRVSIPPSNNRAPCRLAVPEKKSSRCSLARFFDRRISSNPCRSASAFSGTNRSPAPQPPRPAPTPNPLPQGRGPKAKPPNFSGGPWPIHIRFSSTSAASAPLCSSSAAFTPAFGSLISGLATAGSSITFLGGSSSMAGFISRRRSIRIELA